MKKIIFFIVAFLAIARAYAQPLPNTAEYYFISAQSSQNALVTVNVSDIKVLSLIPLNNSYICFECETTAGGKDGGKIRLLLPKWKAAQFFADYQIASEKSPKELRARFTSYVWQDGNSEFLLVID